MLQQIEDLKEPLLETNFHDGDARTIESSPVNIVWIDESCNNDLSKTQARKKKETFHGSGLIKGVFLVVLLYSLFFQFSSLEIFSVTKPFPLPVEQVQQVQQLRKRAPPPPPPPVRYNNYDKEDSDEQQRIVIQAPSYVLSEVQNWQHPGIENGLDTRTTLMVSNIPNKYTKEMLLTEFTENDFGPGIIDFLYLPIDFKNRCNRGYAFINFVDYHDILNFHRQYYGQHWRTFNSDKICDITYARIQGKAAMLKRFENSALIDEDYKPLVFVSDGPDRGTRLPFPDSTEKQRIVILAQSYVPDSTHLSWNPKNLQKSMYRHMGQTIWLDPTHKPEKFRKRPRTAFSEWSFPVGVPEEAPVEVARVGVKDGVGMEPQFHELLGDVMMGSKRASWLLKISDPEKRAEYLTSVTDYYRDLFAVPWSEGKNLVIGTEAFTTLVLTLPGVSNGGEARHVDPYADEMLDRLLDVLPQSDNVEVNVDYRSSRIQNTISLWHTYHNGKTLREFLANDSNYLSLINSLALSLQFVRKGLKVTLVDSEGAQAFQEANDPHKEDIDHMVGLGYTPVFACDILKIADESSAGPTQTTYCDAKSRLHHSNLSRGTKMPPMPMRPDPQPRDMSDAELEQISVIIEKYDCGIWKYLQAYQTKGLLRVLYPSENLFANCKNNDDGRTLSFADMTRKIKNVIFSTAKV